MTRSRRPRSGGAEERARAPAPTCTGPRWVSSKRPASAPSTATCPRAFGASRDGGDPDDDADDDQNIRGETGIDGLRTEDDAATLDLDDVAILLRASQLLRGVKRPFVHLFVDEAQDLSPMKLSVLIGHIPARRRTTPSITLAGDTSQRLFLDNGFGDWRAVLGSPGPGARGHRAAAHRLPVDARDHGCRAGRHGPAGRSRSARGSAQRRARRDVSVSGRRAPRSLSWPKRCASSAAREPRATVALLARYPEQADRYYEGLRRAEVPSLRRVRAQDFAFRPGVEVTDVRQVKGLEFDYVVMLDANDSSYGRDDESRHLFHIGVTRAAWQLWIVVTGAPSPLVPRGGAPDVASGAPGQLRGLDQVPRPQRRLARRAASCGPGSCPAEARRGGASTSR